MSVHTKAGHYQFSATIRLMVNTQKNDYREAKRHLEVLADQLITAGPEYERWQTRKITASDNLNALQRVFSLHTGRNFR